MLDFLKSSVLAEVSGEDDASLVLALEEHVVLLDSYVFVYVP